MAAMPALRLRFRPPQSLLRACQRFCSSTHVPRQLPRLATRPTTRLTTCTQTTSFKRPFMSSASHAWTEDEENGIHWHELSPERRIHWTIKHGEPGSKWGWAVIRTTYNPELDKHWESFKEAIYDKTCKGVAKSDNPHIADSLEWVFIEDPKLEGASLEELKQRFRSWVRAEFGETAIDIDTNGAPLGSRYTYFIEVDEESLLSMMDPFGLHKGHVKIIRGWHDPKPIPPGEDATDEFGNPMFEDEDVMKIRTTLLCPEFYDELENEEMWWLWYNVPPGVVRPRFDFYSD